MSETSEHRLHMFFPGGITLTQSGHSLSNAGDKGDKGILDFFVRKTGVHECHIFCARE